MRIDINKFATILNHFSDVPFTPREVATGSLAFTAWSGRIPYIVEVTIKLDRRTTVFTRKTVNVQFVAVETESLDGNPKGVALDIVGMMRA